MEHLEATGYFFFNQILPFIVEELWSFHLNGKFSKTKVDRQIKFKTNQSHTKLTSLLLA